MKKAIGSDARFEFTVNAYFIQAFAWNAEVPDDLNRMRLTVVYSLGRIGTEGMELSPYPEHRGVMKEVYNSGRDHALTAFLESSGSPEDLWDFNYHDIERVVERDIRERFGIEV